MKKIEDVQFKNQKLIAFLFLVNKETENLEINGITFRKVSNTEKEIFYKYYEGDMVEEVLTHCFEFNINNDFIEYVKSSTAKEPVYLNKDWEVIYLQVIKKY